MNAVAVATAAPTPMPVRMRAMNKPVTLIQSRNRVAAAMVTAIAGSSTARRPYQSDTFPASSRLTTTPTAYTAYTNVIVSEDRCSRCS